MNPYHKLSYLEKYNAVKDTLQFSRCRFWDAIEETKWVVYQEFYGQKWMKKPKPKAYYRRWCINECFFKWE